MDNTEGRAKISDFVIGISSAAVVIGLLGSFFLIGPMLVSLTAG